jgi:Na+/proline symporter
MNAFVGIAFLVVLIWIGILAARRSRGPDDYFLAGRRLGLVVLVLTTMASIMSGFVFVGGPGLFYEIGLGSFWIAISSSFTGALMCWLLARPLFEMSHRRRCLTIPEVIQQRYQCSYSSTLAAVAILVGVVGYLAAQLQALAILLNQLTPFGRETSVILGIGVLVFYTVAGGMTATVRTDVVQGAIMLWVALMIFGFSLDAGGGISHMARVLIEGSPATLSPWGTVGPVVCLGWFFLFSVGSLGQPHVVNRFMMVGDLKSLRYFPLLLALAMLICGTVWLGVGLSIKSLVTEAAVAPLGHPDDAIVVFLRDIAPRWLAPLAYVAVTAAIMSTADSFVGVGAAAATHDLGRVLGLDAGREVAWGRVCSLLIYVAAGALAIWMKTLVAYLGILAFGSFAAALTPALAIGLNWAEAGRWAARASITLGLVLSIVLEVLFVQPGVPSGVIALAGSALVFVILGKVVGTTVRGPIH